MLATSTRLNEGLRNLRDYDRVCPSLWVSAVTSGGHVVPAPLPPQSTLPFYFAYHALMFLIVYQEAVLRIP